MRDQKIFGACTLGLAAVMLMGCAAIDGAGMKVLTAAEVGEATIAERDALLAQLVEDTILYERHETIRPNAIEGQPTHTIDESWTIMDYEGGIGAKVVIVRDLDGNLVQNIIQTVDPKSYVFVDIPSAFYFPIDEQPMWPLENMWFMPMRVAKKDFPVVRASYLNGRPSTVFESTEREVRMEVEVTNDSPLLHRMTFYDEDGGLSEEITLLEYRVIAPERE